MIPDNIEIFEMTERDILDLPAADNPPFSDETSPSPGWYWWFCQPGCLPDSEASGPFPTHDDALEDVYFSLDIDPADGADPPDPEPEPPNPDLSLPPSTINLINPEKGAC